MIAIAFRQHRWAIVAMVTLVALIAPAMDDSPLIEASVYGNT
jgi:hypothetical protein